MKIVIIKSLLLLLLIGSFSYSAEAQARRKAEKETIQWRYEIMCAGVGAQGTYLVKVWSYSRKPVVALEQAKKNAVHGVIFKGFMGQGCSAQKPLVRNSNLETEKAEFFKRFFKDGGEYMKFVTASNEGHISAGDVTKISKREYKVGVIVSVQKDLLRKKLEAEGIIKGLAAGF
ncbi:hypothetical protein [Aureispira anguillae]|uniref:Uncharacterized protein n=1 Tax=Aureispira anguillae TaxID=2864201 RepID=A0A916DUA9_9BACT|nr:hypothetical protein [Aureispira anguillae]BDS13176.1 hypothetical protein AsAng_0039040 [Aureispira anguillae]